MAGLGVDEFMVTEDEAAHSRILAVAQVATRLRRREYDYLARAIINELGSQLK